MSPEAKEAKLLELKTKYPDKPLFKSQSADKHMGDIEFENFSDGDESMSDNDIVKSSSSIDPVPNTKNKEKETKIGRQTYTREAKTKSAVTIGNTYWH